LSLHLVYASAACERYKNARRGGRRRGFAAASLNLNVRQDEVGGGRLVSGRRGQGVQWVALSGGMGVWERKKHNSTMQRTSSGQKAQSEPRSHRLHLQKEQFERSFARQTLPMHSL